MVFATKKAAWFLIRFFVIFGVLQALLVWIDLAPLQNTLAALMANWLGLAFLNNLIFVQGGAFEINNQCTGLVSAAVLAAVVFGLPKPDFKTKTVLFAAGAAGLFLVNILRLLLVVGAGAQFGIGIAEFVHVATWFSTALLILAAWFWGTKKILRIQNFGELM